MMFVESLLCDLADICAVTVAVIADRDTRCERIMERDDLTREEAIMRINAQKKDGFYIENADYIIYNNGNETDTEEKIGRIIKGC